MRKVKALIFRLLGLNKRSEVVQSPDAERRLHISKEEGADLDWLNSV